MAGTLAFTTLKASLVGMKYYSLTREEAALCLSRSPFLRREPQNVHDFNALIVLSGHKQLGHIDRKAAAIIAPLIDDGAVSRLSLDTSRPQSAGSIPVAVRLERQIEETATPHICEIDVPGIYKISALGYERCYIGQSVNIQNRIANHWEELKRGTHQNSELRKMWRTSGSSVFRASVLEHAPSSLYGMELARWLLEREQAWVNNQGGLKKTINVEMPKIVLDAKLRAELNSEREKYSSELLEFEKKSEILAHQISERNQRIEKLRVHQSQASGFKRIFASTEAKIKAKMASEELPVLMDSIPVLENEYQNVSIQHQKLRKHLFLPEF